MVEFTNVSVSRLIKKENQGSFCVCLANNLVGYGSEWTLKLSVRCKFRVLLISNSRRKNLVRPYIYCQREVGQATDFQVDVYMECYVYGYPFPKIT
jgi:hypothetical protein